MKKQLILLPLCVLCFLLTACGGAEPVSDSRTDTAEKDEAPVETPLTLGTVNTSADRAEFTLFKITTTEKVAATMESGLTYENTAAGETFVDVVFDVTNIGTEPLGSADVMRAAAIGADGEVYRQALYAFETNGNTYVMQDTSIEPLTGGRFHCAVSVPETATELKLRFTVGDSVYAIDYTLHTVVRDAVALQIGEAVTAADFAALTLEGIEYTDDLLPADTSGAYRHYPVGNADHTYLVVRLTITNLQSSPKREGTFVNIKARYPDQSAYSGMLVVEDADGRGFSRYEALSPQVETSCCYLIEVPVSVTENEVEITIAFAGKEYVFVG